MTPRIALVAYEDRKPEFIFVAVPNQVGRYVRTDKCVALVACPMCGATVGEPCLSKGEPGSESAKYGAGTHYARRNRAPWGAHPEDVIGKWMPPPVPEELLEPYS